ncbi:MAG TPA: sulfatase [Candidatus Polarisedimenticolia bacterium]|nr:sulfatase [Candidatus Polarisedimenticolia bacterium]
MKWTACYGRAAAALLAALAAAAALVQPASPAQDRSPAAPAAAGLEAGPHGASSAASRRPSAILISIDSLRADHLPFHGYPRLTAPFLNELVEQGRAAYFRRVTSVAPSCHPSHATMLTGLYPQQIGVPLCGEDLTIKPSEFDDPADLAELEAYQESLRKGPRPLRPGQGGALMNYMKLPEETRTLASFYRDRGYRTGGFVSIWTIQDRFGYGEGFQVYDDEMPEYYGPRALTWLLRDVFRSQRRREGSVTVGRALDFLDSVGPGEPFFLFLHLADTHVPYRPPGREGFEEKEDDLRSVRAAWDRRYAESIRPRAMRRMQRGDGFLLDNYDRAIRHADAQVRRLFEKLEAAGRLDDTVILLTSDHGDSFGQHGSGRGGRAGEPFFEHSVQVWEETQGIPMVLVDPLRGASGSRGVNVSQIDIVPTLLSATGWDPREFTEGSVLPGGDILSLPEEPRTVFFMTFGRGKPGLLKTFSLDYPRYIGFRAGDVKFFMDGERLRRGAEGECHLYDLSQDPDEKLNQCGAAGGMEQAERYRAVVVDWWERSAAPGRARRD